MATLTMSPAVRQPFANVDAPRIRSLLKAKMNLKNQQTGTSPVSLKRRAASDSDSENVDPTIVNMSTKRKRSLEDDDLSKESLKPAKSSRLALTTVGSNMARGTTPLSTRVNRASTPASAPAKPAGRSPQSKSRKVFGRRSVNSVSRAEPALAKRAVHRAPFSIAAALSSRKNKTSARPTPSSWYFDIHVDSEQDEMTNLMQHSTCVLDISDDEGKANMDGRGKENIPPHELGIQMPNSTQQVSVPVSRKNMMTNEPRSPLGELNTIDYYGEGCHALSYAIIYDDEPQYFNEKVSYIPAFQAPMSRPSSTKPELVNAATVSSLIETIAPTQTESISEKAEISAPTEADIEIWESGSATEEAASAAAEGAENISVFASA